MATTVTTATMLSLPRPSPTPRITARLIAWEGAFSERADEQKMIKQYTAHLRESIAEALEGSGWRYQRFKTYKALGEASFKLEVRRPDPLTCSGPSPLYPLIPLSAQLIANTMLPPKSCTSCTPTRPILGPRVISSWLCAGGCSHPSWPRTYDP